MLFMLLDYYSFFKSHFYQMKHFSTIVMIYTVKIIQCLWFFSIKVIKGKIKYWPHQKVGTSSTRVMECPHYGWVYIHTATSVSLALCCCGQGACVLPCRPGFKVGWGLSPYRWHKVYLQLRALECSTGAPPVNTSLCGVCACWYPHKYEKYDLIVLNR